jgi:hypothetical protein
VTRFYTEDGTWDAAAAGMGIHRGHAAIRAFFEASFAALRATCHLLSEPVFRLASRANRATGICNVVGWGLRGDGTSVCLTARYDDVYAMTAAGWQLEHRRLTPLLPVPVGDPSMGSLREVMNVHDPAQA